VLCPADCSVARASLLEGVVDRALDTLQGPEDRHQIASATFAVTFIDLAIQINPIKTCGSALTLGLLPYMLYTYCRVTALSNLLRRVANEQLAGDRPLGDWQVAIDVSAQ
jgi:hypothetical protein